MNEPVVVRLPPLVGGQAESWRALIEIDLVVDLRVEPAALEHTNDVLAHEISLVLPGSGTTVATCSIQETADNRRPNAGGSRHRTVASAS